MLLILRGGPGGPRRVETGGSAPFEWVVPIRQPMRIDAVIDRPPTIQKLEVEVYRITMVRGGVAGYRYIGKRWQ